MNSRFGGRNFVAELRSDLVRVFGIVTDFQSLRPRLFGLAYRMLGSRAEAEDIVQDAYVRWHEADRAAIRSGEAWLMTATTRLAIDRLRALKTARDAYKGPWLPEPLVVTAPPRPDQVVEMQSDLSVAFLAVLERLAPDERAAFLLHDVFDRDYPEIANTLGKTEAACRQIVHRAREHVRSGRKRFDVTEAAKAELLSKFAAAVDARDENALFQLFAPDATWTADGGGRAPAAMRPIEGVDRVVRLILALQPRIQGRIDLASINGETGLAIRLDGELTSVMSIETDGERIHAVYIVTNPDKLPLANREG